MIAKYFYLFFVQCGLLYFQFCTANPIIGQTYPADKDEFPFIVYLNYLASPYRKESAFCGGALISKKHVLTSAHCIENESRESIVVVAGTIDYQGGDVVAIDSWMTYDVWAAMKFKTPKYFDNDIAVIILLSEIKNISPGIISNLTADEVDGKKVVTAGWGYTDRNKKTEPDSLRKAYMVVDSDTYTNNWLKFGIDRKPIPNFYYTTSNPQALLCNGDSGGPLLLEDTKEIVGINDGGCNMKNASDNKYAMSMHIKVDCYRDFVEDMLEQDANEIP